MIGYNLENPWKGFAWSPKMVHPSDIESVNLHNQKVSSEYRFLLHLAPEPWIGNIDGNLFVLYANPGATEDNENKIFQPKHQLVMEKTIKNLSQQNKEFPHFHFDPELAGSEGWNWFQQKFKWLTDAVGHRKLAKTLVTCELAPYHSRKWRVPRPMPPTQSFTYELIRTAMKRDATILLARTSKVWIQNIPELEKYPRVYRPSSINASVSPKNYPGNFDKILESLR
jgi:hypothetical protein